jgi:hypothetical protein
MARRRDDDDEFDDVLARRRAKRRSHRTKVALAVGLSAVLGVSAILAGVAVVVMIEARAEKTWFHGRWAYDKETTAQKWATARKAEIEETSKSDDPLKGFAIAFGIMQVFGEEHRIEAFDGAELRITDDELQMTNGGSGRLIKYRLVEQPDENTWRLESGGGTIDFHRDGDRLWFVLDGIRMYFKRAE